MPASTEHLFARYPVGDALPALRNALTGGHAVLTAPPGSGKTTLVPLGLLGEPWLAGQRILMLEPRRIAARNAAQRMADLLGESVGKTVGYQVRFERRVSDATRIEVVTEGILTRRLQHDPALEGTGLVIFDEYHERNLQADLGLAFCLDVVEGLRDNLRLLVMSATLESDSASTLLGDAPIVTAEGLSHPVDIRYLDREPQSPTADTARSVRRALAEQDGDLLVFLPGQREIRQTEEALAANLPANTVVRPLYGNLPFQAQVAALQPDPNARRVVLATDIAETSLTIEGVSTVVDCGLAREPRFDPNNGLTRLVTRRISSASATQRAGRAGRLGPGTCYRLWTETQQRGLEPRRLPEILAADLAPLLLELALWGTSEPATLRWLDPPPGAMINQARELLQRLSAVDAQGRITTTGRRMAKLGQHPRLAHLMLKADELGAGARGTDIAALLSERDPLSTTPGQPRPADIELRLNALSSDTARGADKRSLNRIRQTATQLRRRLGGSKTSDNPASAGSLLALAFPDRIAQARDADSGKYLLANGRGAKLASGDALTGTAFVVAAHVDAAHRDGRIFLAAPISLDEIREHFGAHIEKREHVSFDDRTASVVAREVEQLDAITLSERILPRPSAASVTALLLAEIRRQGLDTALPMKDDALALRHRVQCLREWQPDGDWPDWSDEGLLDRLESWLAPWLDGVRKMSDLKRLKVAEVLHAELGWDRAKKLNRLAPTHLKVPSGNRKRLTYSPGEAPVLAVKLQELFGLDRTPSVCDGRIPLLLHLLSPAGRPIQVTRDLESFWQNTYPEVRKELKGRYPKHPWPDDPWNAVPTAGVKRRKR